MSALVLVYVCYSMVRCELVTLGWGLYNQLKAGARCECMQHRHESALSVFVCDTWGGVCLCNPQREGVPVCVRVLRSSGIHRHCMLHHCYMLRALVQAADSIL